MKGYDLNDTTEVFRDETNAEGSQEEDLDTIARTLQTGLGDTSLSAPELHFVQAVAKQLVSTSSKESVAMKKAIGHQLKITGVPKSGTGIVPVVGASYPSDDNLIANPTIHSPTCTPAKKTKPNDKSTSSAADMNFAQVENLLIQFVAESKIRHEEVLDRINRTDKTVNKVL